MPNTLKKIPPFFYTRKILEDLSLGINNIYAEERDVDDDDFGKDDGGYRLPNINNNISVGRYFLLDRNAYPLNLPNQRVQSINSALVTQEDLTNTTSVLESSIENTKKHQVTDTHALKSLNTVLDTLNVAHSVANLTPLAAQYPDTIRYTGYLTQAFSFIVSLKTAYADYLGMDFLLSGHLSYWPSLIKMQKLLSCLPISVVKTIVDGAFNIGEYLISDGNFSENPEYYASKDISKFVIAAFFPAVTKAYLLIQAPYITYNWISSKYLEDAYIAMIKNATYHIDQNNFDLAKLSLIKLEEQLKYHHNGLTYSTSDSIPVTQAKVYLYNYKIKEYFNQGSYVDVMRESNLGSENKSFPLHLIIQSMLLRLDIQLIRKFYLIFSDDFNKIYDFVLSDKKLQESSKNNFEENMQNIAQTYRNNLAYCISELLDHGHHTTDNKYFIYLSEDLRRQPPWHIHLDPDSSYLLGRSYLKSGNNLRALQLFDDFDRESGDLYFWIHLIYTLRVIKNSIEDRVSEYMLQKILYELIDKALYLYVSEDKDKVDIEIKKAMEEMIHYSNELLYACSQFENGRENDLVHAPDKLFPFVMEMLDGENIPEKYIEIVEPVVLPVRLDTMEDGGHEDFSLSGDSIGPGIRRFGFFSPTSHRDTGTHEMHTLSQKKKI